MQDLQHEHNVNNSASQVVAGFWVAVSGYVIVATILLLCGYYVYTHRDEFEFLSHVSYPEVAGASLMILISYILNAHQLNLFLRNFKLSLGLVELISLTMAMNLGNLLIPMRGGSGGMAVYLKKNHGLNFQTFAAIYSGTALLICLISSGSALGALIYLALINGFHNAALDIVISAIFAFCLYLSVFPPPLKWKMHGILGFVFGVGQSWHLLSRNRGLLFRLTLSLVGISFTMIMAFYFIYRALGAELSFSAVVITSSLGIMANLIPITPGSLGFFDAATIQVPQVFNLDITRSFSATAIFRVISIFWALVLGIPGLAYLFLILPKIRANDDYHK